MPDGEVVHVDERQHPVALLVPGLRTLLGLVALCTGLRLLPLLLFAAAVGWWASSRMHVSARTAAICAAVASVALLYLGTGSPLRWSLAAVLVMAWGAEDALGWWDDRLVITDKRVYRRYGWVTQHAPSMALQSAVFVDVSTGPLERLFGCGTLRFDSAAQRDAPLSRFDLVADVERVHHRVLELRAAAMRRQVQ